MELPLAVPNLVESRELPGILDVSDGELKTWLAEQGEPAWHAKGIRRWILARGVTNFNDMTDLSKSLRQKLQTTFQPFRSKIARHHQADDDTHKLVLELAGKKWIECVLIQEDDRRTACISTQVGCGMGCVFCASGLNGVERNLTVGELLEQLVLLRNLPGATPEKHLLSSRDKEYPTASSDRTVHRLTHIVVMGMGEPLANLENLLAALDVATHKDGLGIGARHITISSVGLPTKIRKLADSGRPYHLAVSLHAPNQPLRSEIVPTNEKTGLAEILEAADYYFDVTGRQITYEYVLLRDINDRVSHARELVKLLHGRHAHVNLIPFNDVEGLPYRRPETVALNQFVETLRHGGLSVKVRKRKGSQIDAACGQLRRNVMRENERAGILE